MGAGASTDVDVKSIPEVQAANARLEALEAQVARLTEALQQANAANGSPAAAGGAGPAGASGAGSGEASESKSEMGWFDVGEASGFEEGTMAEVSVPAEGATDPTPVLLVREKGTGAFHAVGGRCTHYGAPLAKGVLSGCRVTCPWHSACFDASTGDVEDGCALDALPTYDARVSEAGVVQIHARRKATDRAARRAPTVKPGAVGASSGAIDGPGMLIVGSGPAGLTAAQTLREEGWQGKITMVTAEDRLPYDRVQLSKRLSGSPRLLRPASFFQEHEIDVRLGERVVAVDSAARTVSLKSGATLPYGKLLCATGSFARRCTEEQAPLSGGFFLPGADLPGVFAVRVADDAARITAALDEAAAARDGGARVVIVGASFVGMEVAATIAASGKAESVTVMDINAQPYERVLGAEIGACIRRLHGEESGGVVKFLMPAKVTSFAPAEGDAGGRVAVVNVEGSDAVPCDFVVLGCGALPEVDYLTKTAGVELNAPATGGGVVVDDKLKAADHVYAAGDIAAFPNWAAARALARVEHWDVATQQGRVAARNMLGAAQQYRTVPFFWAQQFSFKLRYAGHAPVWDEQIFQHGSPGSDSSWVAYFVRDGVVAAVVTLNKDPFAVAAAELFRLAAMPTVAELRAGNVDLAALVREVS